MNSETNVHTIEQLLDAEQIWSEVLGTGYDSVILDMDIYARLFS